MAGPFYNPYPASPYGQAAPYQNFGGVQQPFQQFQQPAFQQIPQQVQQQAQMPPQMPMQAQPQAKFPALEVKAVTDVKEAEAVSVPFDDTILIFPDFAHGKIYTKQWNRNTGGSTFLTYDLAQNAPAQPAEAAPAAAAPAPQFVPVEDFNALKKEFEDFKSSISVSAKQEATGPSAPVKGGK